MLLQLIALVGLLVLAVTAAVWARLEQTHPADVVNRIRGVRAVPSAALFIPPVGAGRMARFAAWLQRTVPPIFATTKQQERLVQAGFGSAGAPALYVAAQLVCAVVGITVMAYFAAGRDSSVVVVSCALGAAVGWLIPPTIVARIRDHRQQRMRLGLPDVLDLMLVCVEAGISLDAAILRVGREVALVHPELSEELLTLGRKQNAGIPREDALRGMWNRTGLTELRALSANIIQSERWGTSMARVLRIESESLRRKRREAAEKRAALASTKMIFPLALLILPALLIVIGGPMLIQIRDIFDAISH